MISTKIFHFSDRGNISSFVPKTVDVPSARKPGEGWLNGPLVWAVDNLRQATYLFPRDCPRICIWPTPLTTPEDLAMWWGDRKCTMIVHVEWAWLERIRLQELFRYELPYERFRQTSDEWMWVADAEVVPVSVERIEYLLEALERQGVELRVMDSLLPLRPVWQSTMHASGIRLRNAQGWSAQDS